MKLKLIVCIIVLGLGINISIAQVSEEEEATTAALAKLGGIPAPVSPAFNTTTTIANFNSAITEITEGTALAGIGLCLIQVTELCPVCYECCGNLVCGFCKSPLYGRLNYCLSLTIVAFPAIMNYGLNMLLYSVMFGWICPVMVIGLTAPCCFCFCIPLICSPILHLWTIGIAIAIGIVSALADTYVDYSTVIKMSESKVKMF